MLWMLTLVLATEPSTTGGPQVAIGASLDYTIGPGDVLTLEVFGETDMSREMRVGGDGQISVPYAGSLNVNGMTLDQAKAAIVARLSEQVLVSPQVDVRVLNYGRAIEVTGRVKNSGRYPIIQDNMTVTQALTAAGGALDTSAPTATLNRGNQQYVIDLEAINNGDNSKDMMLQPGDRIVVPDSPTVQVQGAVKNSGQIPYRHGLRLTDAVAQAGMTETANHRKVQLTHNGKTVYVNYMRILKQLEEDPVLDPGDQIVVLESSI